MLNKSYGNCFIGKNYLSLLHAIRLLKKSHTCVLIDDHNLSFANKWYLNIGEIEKKYLKYLCQRYSSDHLFKIEDYLKPKKTILNFNNKIIEFGNGPFNNLKELARKIPEFYDNEVAEFLSSINENDFDQYFFEYLDYALKYEIHLTQDISLLSKRNALIFKIVKKFDNFINEGSLIAKQLHNVLQMMYQSIFSASHIPVENHYLFLSTLAPRYEVKEHELEEKLLKEFLYLGGALKATSIKDWGFKKNSLEFVCLSSIDGVISVGHCYFYAQTIDNKPFKTHYAGTKFRSIEILGRIDHEYIDFLSGKRLIFSKEDRMGTDFPYWEASIDHKGILRGVYAFSDYQGTKPDFYFHHAVEDFYESLNNLMPGIDRSDWVYNSNLYEGSDSWIRVDDRFKKHYVPGKRDDLLKFYPSDGQKSLLKIENCGPNRSKSLGLYGQLLDIFSEQFIIE